jgi:hypothetical protein
MNIIEAMQKLKLGKTISRKSHRLLEKTYGIKHDRPIFIIEETEKGQWVENPKGCALELQTPEGFKMIFLEDDILANDWEVVEY